MNKKSKYSFVCFLDINVELLDISCNLITCSSVVFFLIVQEIQSYLALPDDSVANRDPSKSNACSVIFPVASILNYLMWKLAWALALDSFIALGQSFQQHWARCD